MNIYEKMLEISNRVEKVRKELEVKISDKNSYKAVGEASVLEAIKPLEYEYKVYSYPIKREIVESGVLESGNTKKLYERIEVTYRFVNIEKPEEYVDIMSYGDGIDSQDKSVGKAMTYADKYALMKAYKIVTGDDPDQYPSEPLKSVTIKVEEKLLEKARELQMDLEKVAIAYGRKSVEEITNEDLRKAIERQTKAIEDKKNGRTQ